MRKQAIVFILTLIAAVAVFYPVAVWYSSARLTLGRSLPGPGTIFPVLGLMAFATMWLHIVGGAFQEQLEKYIDFVWFVHWSSTIVLFLIILHPLLFLFSLAPQDIPYVFAFNSYYIWLAVAGWLLLITYDIGKIFQKRQFFIKHWEAIKFISTIGFFFIFFHSLGLGDDLHLGPLRLLWYFYGTTAALAAMYSFGLKRILK